MTNINMIPLTKLVESDDNVRRTNRKGGIAELAASIQAVGLLQSLVVRENGSGRYAVIAGGRRLRALRSLARAGSIAKSTPIPCRIVAADEAAEMSLAENVVRADLCPADEIEGIARLAADGQGIETIAARFGVSPPHVARRLKLACVSPRLIEALRNDEATLDQLAALAFTHDHAAQEAAFFDAPDWARTPQRLKAQVTQTSVPETDKLARFVGLEAYQAAGGQIVTDLFAEDGDRRWLADRALLMRLAEAQLEPIAEEARGEGWAWVEIDIDGPAWARYPERVRETRRALTGEEQAEQERLYALLDQAQDEAEIEKIETQIDALAGSGWDSADVALAGAVITLAVDGAPRFERGLVRLEDVKRLRALRRRSASTPAEEGAATSPAIARSQLPAKLVEELMAHKSWGHRLSLANKPDLSLRVLAFTLAGVLIEQPRIETCLDVRIAEADLSRSISRADSPAPSAFAALKSKWRKRLPGDAAALWSFLLAADQETLLELLAVLIAPGIDLRVARPARDDDLKVQSGELFAEAACLDMSQFWTVTPDSFFAHVRKDVIVDALIEAKPALDRAKLEKAPKSELLSRVKRTFTDSAWLPAPLRTPTAVVTPQAIAAE